MAWYVTEIWKVDPIAKFYSANENYQGTKTIYSIANYHFHTIKE